ncbi:hypothetical protein DPMN_030662 [Dreissena polymorpha]|uniref:Uncharacterized protein n=1 Tax=Dreissena polymorpha TaxID=45954 RepID=A0A9D4M0T5_DREPO|nr:hypothetical protein DPMN_030662 [Dreissena polymorpha]
MRIENKTAQHGDVNDANDVKHKQLRRETVGERLQHNCKEMNMKGGLKLTMIMMLMVLLDKLLD